MKGGSLMELIFNALIAIVIVIYLLLSLKLGPSTTEGDIFGAGGFPIIIAILGLIVLGIVTLEVIKKGKKIDIPMFKIKTTNGRAVTLNVLALSVYVALMGYLGFILSTPLFLVSSAKSMGYKNNKALALFTVVTTVALVVVFGKIFYIPLPRGIGVLRDLSYYIY